jgi:predicted amidophosphoribosyltransferase
MRRVQAREAFGVRTPIDSEVTYLLVDDIYTTGSTVEFASLALKGAGARTVFVAVVARQPLD